MDGTSFSGVPHLTMPRSSYAQRALHSLDITDDYSVGKYDLEALADTAHGRSLRELALSPWVHPLNPTTCCGIEQKVLLTANPH